VGPVPWSNSPCSGFHPQAFDALPDPIGVTVPVNVDGEVNLCDCQPEVVLGNLLEKGLDSFWNGECMVEHRMAIGGAKPPAACLECPRF
jgi:hypothetical protein